METRAARPKQTMANKILMLGVLMLACAVSTFAQDNNNRPSDRGGDRGSDRGGDRRSWDPARFQEMMMQGVKERLEITDEAEWKAVQPLVEKVMTAQRQVAGDRMRGMMMGRRGSDDRRPGGDDRRPSGGIFGATPNPEADALQRAIDSKASKSDLQVVMKKFVAAREAHQAELERAQNDLRKVLTPRQEAIATLAGWL